LISTIALAALISAGSGPERAPLPPGPLVIEGLLAGDPALTDGSPLVTEGLLAGEPDLLARRRRRRRRYRRRRPWMDLDPDLLETEGRSMSRTGIGMIVGGAVGIGGGIVTYLVGAGMLFAQAGNNLTRNDGTVEESLVPVGVMVGGIAVGVIGGGLLGWGISMKVRYIRATPTVMVSPDGASLGVAARF